MAVLSKASINGRSSLGLGARLLRNQRANLSIPRIGATANYYWLATEATATTESQQTFTNVAMSPKTIASYTEVSRQLLLQANPDVEDVTMSDHAAILGVGLNTAVVFGPGGTQPAGIANGASANVNTVVGTTASYDTVLEFQDKVLTASAMTNAAACAYLGPTAIARKLGNRQEFTGTDATLWQGNLAEGTIAGFPAYSSEIMPANYLLFGDWSTCMVAEWGVLSLEVNPFANFQAGIVGLRAMYSVDCAFRHKQSWSLSTNVT